MTPSVLLTVGAEQPLIDLDWTLLVQLGLFGLTALVATRLLFRPYLAMREERSAGMEGARQEAERLSAEADTQMADYEARLTSARQKAQEERRKLRAEAAREQAALTDRAREEAGKTVADAHAQLERETTTARDELMPRADKLAGEIATKLLGREVGS